MLKRSKVEDTSLPIMSRKRFNVSAGSWAAVHESCKEVPSLGGGGAGRVVLLGSCSEEVLRQVEDSNPGNGVEWCDIETVQSLGSGGSFMLVSFFGRVTL